VFWKSVLKRGKGNGNIPVIIEMGTWGIEFKKLAWGKL
jgi:hypothetical protein